MEILLAIFTVAICISAIIEIIRVCIDARGRSKTTADSPKHLTAEDFHKIIYKLWMHSSAEDNRTGFIATISDKEFVVKYRVEHLAEHPNALLLCILINGEFVCSTLRIYCDYQEHFSLHIDRKYIKEEVYQIIEAAASAYFKHNDPEKYKKSLLGSKEA